MGDPSWTEATARHATRRFPPYHQITGPAFRVEMSIIGLHYTSWRHPTGRCAE